MVVAAVGRSLAQMSMRVPPPLAAPVRPVLVRTMNRDPYVATDGWWWWWWCGLCRDWHRDHRDTRRRFGIMAPPRRDN